MKNPGKFVRSGTPGVVINKDTEALKEYKKQRETTLRIKALEDKVAVLEKLVQQLVKQNG